MARERRGGGGRVRSVDVVRGATVAAMIVVNNPGDPAHVLPQLRHATWHGFTFADAVFPAFLFVMGASLGLARVVPAARVLRRAAVLVLLGLLVNWVADPVLSTLRWPGVLQRIGVTYAVAAVVVRGGPAAVAASAVAALTGAWALLSTAPLTPEANRFGVIDRAVFGDAHLYVPPIYEPEGLASTLPALGTVLLGVLAGLALRRWGTKWTTVLALAVGATVAVAAGTVLSGAMPLNKRLWTPPYALLTAGLTAAAVALAFAVVDAARRGGVGRPFEVLGRNALLAYTGSELLTLGASRLRVAGSPDPLPVWLHRRVVEPFVAGAGGSLVWGLLVLAFWWLVLWALWRRDTFVTV